MICHKIFRSPLFYVGDKYRLIREIKSHFPVDIAKFIEPFAGGGSVFLNVNANDYVLNDIDTYVYKLHTFLLQQAQNPSVFFEQMERIILNYGLSRSYKEDIIPIALKEKWKKTYYAHFNKLAFNELKTDFNNSNQSDMTMFYILLIYGFNRMIRFNGKGHYNLPVGNVDLNKNVIVALNDYFSIVKQKNISWHNLDYSDFLSKIDVAADDFLYFDPPYLITFSEYNKLWNEQKEIELTQLLTNLNKQNIRFAVSNVTHYKGKENTIFLRWAESFNCYPIKSNYISYHDNTAKNFKEVLITNYG